MRAGNRKKKGPCASLKPHLIAQLFFWYHTSQETSSALEYQMFVRYSFPIAKIYIGCSPKGEHICLFGFFYFSSNYFSWKATLFHMVL